MTVLQCFTLYIFLFLIYCICFSKYFDFCLNKVFQAVIWNADFDNPKVKTDFKNDIVLYCNLNYGKYGYYFLNILSWIFCIPIIIIMCIYVIYKLKNGRN